MSDSTPDVRWHPSTVTRPRGCVVWLTGLSGSGKSTIANAVDELLFRAGVPACVLDGDNLRHGLNASPEMLVDRHGATFASRFGLGFSPQDREENIRRTACVSELFCAAGLVVLTAFVSPYRRDRDLARALVVEKGNAGDFLEVFVDTPLETCEQRDPKGLYRRARAGEIRDFTGIDSPYEPPLHAELVLKAGSAPVESLANGVVERLKQAGKLRVRGL